MPTTYAHDLFGKRVYRKLSAKLQHLIRSNGNLYRIGQHGPDILFYYFISKNPVTQYGVQMHGRKAREFFEKGMAKVREEKNPALMAYLLGVRMSLYPGFYLSSLRQSGSCRGESLTYAL